MRSDPIIIAAGLFSGLGAALWTMLEYALGWHNQYLEVGAKTGYIALVFPVAAIIWALTAIRRAQGGQLTLKQAVICGLGMSAISAFVGMIFFYIYYTWINPAFIVAMRARGHEVDVLAQLLAVAIGSLLVGLFLSVVAGIFLRSKPVAEP